MTFIGHTAYGMSVFPNRFIEVFGFLVLILDVYET
jgi:hypothetical protein